MMQMNTVRPAMAVVLATALLTGCLFRVNPELEKVPVDETNEVLEQIERVREALAALEDTDRLEEVRIPLAESWLEQPLRARYRALQANSAFRLVAQGHPVRFNFDETLSPLIQWPPTARTIRQHLDAIAAQADWSYTLEEGVVQVRNIETRQFILNAQPGAVESAINLRGLKDAGSALNDNSMSLSLDPYAGTLERMVQNILAQQGTVMISPSANMLVVTARPNAMRVVERMIEGYNRSVSQIVRLELALIEVTFDDTEKRDSLLQLIRRSNDIPVGLLIDQTGGRIGAGSGAFPSDLAAAPGQYRYDGSAAVFEWLDTFGDANINFDDTVEVINNHVASVDVTESEQYVSRVSREVSEEGVDVEVEFRELNTGIVIHLQPTVVGDMITLRLGLSRSTPLSRQNYQFGTVSGTTFRTSDFNRLLSVSLADGEPKLLASLSSANSRDRRTGVPVPLFSSLGIGTGKEANAQRRETVMLITATIL